MAQRLKVHAALAMGLDVVSNPNRATHNYL